MRLKERGVSVDAPCEPDLPGGAKVVLHTDCFDFAADDPGEQATDALVGQAGQLGASRSWACNPWEPQARAGSADTRATPISQKGQGPSAAVSEAPGAPQPEIAVEETHTPMTLRKLRTLKKGASNRALQVKHK